MFGSGVFGWQPPWYKKAESFFERFSWALWAGGAVIIAVTIYLLVSPRKKTLAAAWLTYLFMP